MGKKREHIFLDAVQSFAVALGCNFHKGNQIANVTNQSLNA